MTYTLWIFGEKKVYRRYNKALIKAKLAHHTYANGFVQIIDNDTGKLRFGKEL
jgi:hypothetical protein